ncbi:hypothetical protein RND81_13G014200 [Saponaria officinalis]|uniref:Ubiquitin carboxyl-terminal hydrolase n=1 Tax=Saponaria officinalis TaxID=3572 RepID=A0AAW1H377_SAPOF
MEENPVIKTLEVENPSPNFDNSEEFLGGSIIETVESDEVLGMRENPFDETVIFKDSLMDFDKYSDVIVAQETKTLKIDEIVRNVEFDTMQLENPVSDCCEKEGIQDDLVVKTLEKEGIDDDSVVKTLEEFPETMKLGNPVSECCDDAQAAKTLEEFTQDVVTEVGNVLECDGNDGDKSENVRLDEILRLSGESEDADFEGRVHVDELIENSINFGRGCGDAGDNANVDKRNVNTDGIVGPLRQYLPKHCGCYECFEREQSRKRCNCGQCFDGEDNYDEGRGMMGYYSNSYDNRIDHPYYNHQLMAQLYRNNDRFSRRRMDNPISKREHDWRMKRDPEYRNYYIYSRQYPIEGEAEDSPLNNLSFMNGGDGFMEREDRQNRNRNRNRSSELSESEQCLVGAGLANLGNTCFLNAVIQCFIHTASFVEGIQSLKHEASSHGKDEFCVLCAVCRQVEYSLTFLGKIIAPYNLVDNLNHISSDFRRYQQEDAHEFLQCLLDKIDSHWFTHEVNADEASSSHDSLMKQVFGGRLLSQLHCCECGHNSDSYEPVNNLSLEIEDVDDLESALKSFTTVENLQDFTCGSCNEKVRVEKQLLLDQGPSVAALHLKRFKSDGIRTEKIDKMVKYPLEFDLEPYTNGARNDNENLKYELYAFVVHIGLSSTLGHYFCYIRTSPNTWYRFDDSKVTRVSESTALDQEAYILFYARNGTPWFSDLLEKWRALLEQKSNASPKSVLDTTNLPATTSVQPGVNLNGCKDTDITSSALVIYAEPLSCLKPDELQKENPSVLAQESTEANTSGVSSLSEPVHNDVLVRNTEVDFQVLEEANGCSNEPSTCQKNDNLSVGGPKYDGVDVNPCISTEPKSSEESAAEQVTYEIPLDHLKVEEKASSLTTVKGRSGKARRDLDRKEAAKYVKLSGIPFDRRRILMACLSKKRRKSSCSTHKQFPKKRVKISPKRPLRAVAATV